MSYVNDQIARNFKTSAQEFNRCEKTCRSVVRWGGGGEQAYVLLLILQALIEDNNLNV